MTPQTSAMTTGRSRREPVSPAPPARRTGGSASALSDSGRYVSAGLRLPRRAGPDLARRLHPLRQEQRPAGRRVSAARPVRPPRAQPRRQGPLPVPRNPPGAPYVRVRRGPALLALGRRARPQRVPGRYRKRGRLHPRPRARDGPPGDGPGATGPRAGGDGAPGRRRHHLPTGDLRPGRAGTTRNQRRLPQLVPARRPDGRLGTRDLGQALGRQARARAR